MAYISTLGYSAPWPPPPHPSLKFPLNFICNKIPSNILKTSEDYNLTKYYNHWCVFSAVMLVLVQMGLFLVNFQYFHEVKALVTLCIVFRNLVSYHLKLLWVSFRSPPPLPRKFWFILFTIYIVKCISP